MNSVTTRALRLVLWRLALTGWAIFGPARTWNYWQGWVFLAAFFIPEFGLLIYLARHDQGLLERRLKGGMGAEQRPLQKAVMFLVMISFSLMIISSSRDHQINPSAVPPELIGMADGLLILGQWVVFRVFRENTFGSITIGTVPGQRVISTGPYAWVRHPMYSGFLLGYLTIPLALGSWRGLAFSGGLLLAFVIRLLDEERFLRQSLPGYAEYCQTVPDRLIPKVW